MIEYRICEVCEHPNDVSLLECSECHADLSHVYPTTLPKGDIKSPQPAQPAFVSPARTVRMVQVKLIHEKSGKELLIPITGGLIGREGTIDSEFFAAYPYVSNMHARISFTEYGWAISDEHSMNGTFLNEQRLEPGKAYPMQNGDKVVFANVAIIVRAE